MAYREDVMLEDRAAEVAKLCQLKAQSVSLGSSPHLPSSNSMLCNNARGENP